MYYKIVNSEDRSQNSRASDYNLKINLKSENNEINETNLLSNLSLADRLDYERQLSLNFKIYGTINICSSLNQIPTTYRTVDDFFRNNIGIESGLKTIKNSFDFYVVKPSVNATKITGSEYYLVKYDVISTPNEIDIIKNEIGRNIFGENEYNFIVKKPIKLDNTVDFTNKPVSKIYIFADYKPKNNEERYYSKYSKNLNITLIDNPQVDYEIGDSVDGDIFYYPTEVFNETKIVDMKYYIDCPYEDGSESKILRFKYSPFIEIKLRDYSDIINSVNTGNTYNYTYPEYYKSVDSYGNIIWQNLLDFGYIEPSSDNGVDFPFLNNSHYVFNNIIIEMQPDLTHDNTLEVFNEILLKYENLSNRLNNPIDNVSESC